TTSRDSHKDTHITYTTLFRSKEAEEKNLDPENVIELINKKSKDYSPKDENTVTNLEEFGKLNVSEMIDNIVESHHKTFNFPNSRSEEHTSELQSRFDLVCRLL